MYRSLLSVAFFLVPLLLRAQQKSDMQQILDRLERIEQENKNLADEVRALREELAVSRGVIPAASQADVPAPPITERMDVAEQRIADQAQSKVEASQKLPITLTGMLLFNSYLNGRASGGLQDPTIAQQGNNSSAGGATVSQSVVGLKFQGPQVLGGGQLSGSAYLDAWGGSPSNSLGHLIRLRTATVQIDWKNTTVMAGQEKPIISPRDPNSLALVFEPPLTSAGNLWLWSPQVRMEQRFHFGSQAGFTAQAGVYETSEPSYASRITVNAAGYTATSTPRPAIEGRFEFWRKFGESGRVEIAPGFHESMTHVDGLSAPSKLATLDWLIQPVSKIQFTGMYFTGENAAGIGGLRQGFSLLGNDYHLRAVPIGANGGWMQLSYFATRRLTFNGYGGEENDRLADLLSGDIHNNKVYGVNAIYRLGSNVLLGAEVSQARTTYYLLPSRLNNHYDLSVGYLF
jgi:hypothetical protein